jgi:hypothetical protein
MKEVFASVRRWFTGWLSGGPHFVVGSPDRPYLLRWYGLPRNPWFNVYLHKFCRDDDDRALHDHPWPYWSLILRGGYWEVTWNGRRWHGPGSLLRRRAEHRHRVELLPGHPCWTLFLTGPRVREWGFWCPQGFVHWKAFTAPGDVGQVGKGCDQ